MGLKPVLDFEYTVDSVGLQTVLLDTPVPLRKVKIVASQSSCMCRNQRYGAIMGRELINLQKKSTSKPRYVGARDTSLDAPPLHGSGKERFRPWRWELRSSILGPV